MRDDIYNFIDNNFSKHIENVQKFLKIPSVSNENRGLLKAAKWLKNELNKKPGLSRGADMFI